MTHSVGHPAPATPVTPATEPEPAPEPGSARAPQPASLGRALAPIGLISAVTAGTASWQILGPWPTVGGVCGLLILAGGVARWREGARPTLPGAPAGWRWRATTAMGARTPRAPAPSRSAPRATRARTVSPAALARPRPRRATPVRSPLAQPRTRAHGRDTKRKGKRGKARAGWRWRAPEWGWTRGTLAVLITPVALLLSGATYLVDALRPTLARPEEPDSDDEETPPARAPARPAPVPGPAVARPGPAIARPTPAPAGTSSSRSTSMSPSSSPHTYAAADAIRDYIGGFVPQNAADLTGFVCGLHEVFDALQESLGRINTQFSDDEPVDPLVVEHLNELRGMLASLVDVAAEAGPLFLAAHAADLERLENPRPNEQKMDYSQQ